MKKYDTVCTNQSDVPTYETALLPSAVHRDYPAVKLQREPSTNQSSLTVYIISN